MQRIIAHGVETVLLIFTFFFFALATLTITTSTCVWLPSQQVQNIIGSEPLNKANKWAKTKRTIKLAGKRYTSVECVEDFAVCSVWLRHIVRYQTEATERESSCENITWKYGEAGIFLFVFTFKF